MITKEFDSLESYESYIKDLTAQNIPQNIQDLWNSIIDLSDAPREVGAVGNSGEFHTQADEDEADADYEKAMTNLIDKFSEMTGYIPQYKEVNHSCIIHRSKKKDDVFHMWFYGYYVFIKK